MQKGPVSRVLQFRQRCAAEEGLLLLDSDSLLSAFEAGSEFLEDEIPRALDQSVLGLDRIAKILSSMRELDHPGVDGRV